jgi:predicted ribosome quality control (RQC) complex YloA/Tae2 family protein
MKQRVTSEDIACLVPVLNKILDGAYLTQIYDGTPDSTKIVILKFRQKIEDKSVIFFLLIESGLRIHTIESFESVRKLPSSCVGKFRKEIGDKRLYPIEQIGTDRSLDFRFSNSKHFITEMYDRGNFILTDEEYKILYIARPYDFNGKKLDIGVTYPKEEISKSCVPLTNDISLAKGYLIEKQNFSGFPIESNKPVIELDDINMAMQKYFKYEIKQSKKEITKKKKQVNKEEKVKINIQNQISKLDKNKEKILNRAYDLESNVDEIQQMIDLINEYSYQKISYSDIETMLNDQFDQNIKLNHEFLIINDIKIDYRISAYANVSMIYSENKVVKKKIERAEDALTNVKPVKIVEPKEKLVIDRKISYFESYWWFISNGFVIMCGKSADDNESILKNMESSDILVHGNFDKSPWAIIKNPDKLDVPIKIIAYTGDFLVQRSWSWTEVYPNDSYYTYPDKVSKSAPSGEFMGKGSRMVHEKNFLSTATLEMSVGVIFRSGNKYLHKLEKDDKIDYAMVMCAPHGAMLDFDFKIKVRPSGKKNDKGRKKLIQNIINKLLSTKSKLVICKDYIRAIPYDEWDKVCIRTFSL